MHRLLAVFTVGISEGAAAAAAVTVADLAAGPGVTVSTEIATIAGTTLATAAFAGVESVTVDLAVTQPVSIALGESKGFSLDEASRAATDGMLYGGMFGAAGGTARVVADSGGSEAVFGDSFRFRLNSAALDEMGKERYWKLLQSEDSKVPVPPTKPGDFELVSGDPVYFGKVGTSAGLGLNQTPTIGNNGYWRIYLPVTH
ncbi:hypothetical protein AB0E10_19435 [Streptomyces sp. NPDC048045]|uniref:hypothetical protein n=1 Tax=Streptomyces sp. NPDC048045 TaxID=3154710 RepID=UPI003437E9C1